MQAIDDWEDDDGLTTERRIVELLAHWITRYGTVEEMNAAINSLINIQGKFLNNRILCGGEQDLNEVERRSVLITLVHRTWSMRLAGRAPTKGEFEQAFADVLRFVGDDPKHGLPQKRRRTSTRRANPVCEVVRLVPPATQGSENNVDENDKS
jgi:hypothetical protein